MSWPANLLPALLLSKLPRIVLARALGRSLAVPGYHFQPAFSGRVALYELAVRLASPVVLIPDYLCDVVPRALGAAGCTVLRYALDERFEFDLDRVLTLAEEAGAGLILTASLYGSDGGLGALEAVDVQARLKRMGSHLVVDICQDIELRARLPSAQGGRIHGLVSFNDKSFPGAMGGGLLTADPWQPKRRATTSGERRALFGRQSGETRFRSGPRVSRNIPDPSPEHSRCAEFPYRVEALEPVKLQWALALLGLRRRALYRRRQREYIGDGAGLLGTPHALTAAYLVVTDECRLRARRRKGPYAVLDEPDRSLRPGLRVVHNKGFWDDPR